MAIRVRLRMVVQSRVLLAAVSRVLGVAGLVGCSDASGMAQGGTTTSDGGATSDAASITTPDGGDAASATASEGGDAASVTTAEGGDAASLTTADASDAADGTAAEGGTSLPPNCLAGGTNSGSRWQDLYACYFGPMGTSNCGLSTCHDASGSASFWICGTDPTTCWTGMTTSSIAGFPAIVPPGSASDPTQTTLYLALRKATPSGPNEMPFMPASVIYSDADMLRISAWIKAGAPND